MERFFVGITGASGHAYAEALIRGLVAAGKGVDLCVTPAGALVLAHELGVASGAGGSALAAALPGWLGATTARAVRAYASDQVGAPAASGTALTGGVVVCPCSMGTLARIAAGFSSNLIERAADVALKEGKRLVLVPRETPLSAVHLENMLRLARLGAIVLPAMPGFYHRPETVADLVGHVVGKVLDRLGVANPHGVRWAGTAEPPAEPGTGAAPPSDPLARAAEGGDRR